MIERVVERGIREFVRLAHALTEYLKLVEIIGNVYVEKSMRGESRGEAFIVEPDRLFELYTYYLFVAGLLYSLGRRYENVEITILRGGNMVRIRADDLEYEILHSIIPSDQGLFKGSSIGSGEPDISIKDPAGKVLFVGDAKLRRVNVKREARVVLGYMREYGARYGSLIYEPNIVGEKVAGIEEIRQGEHLFYVVRLDIMNYTEKTLWRHIEQISREIIDKILVY